MGPSERVWDGFIGLLRKELIRTDYQVLLVQAPNDERLFFMNQRNTRPDQGKESSERKKKRGREKCQRTGTGPLTEGRGRKKKKPRSIFLSSAIIISPGALQVRYRRGPPPHLPNCPPDRTNRRKKKEDRGGTTKKGDERRAKGREPGRRGGTKSSAGPDQREEKKKRMAEERGRRGNERSAKDEKRTRPPKRKEDKKKTSQSLSIDSYWSRTRIGRGRHQTYRNIRRTVITVHTAIEIEREKKKKQDRQGTRDAIR